MNRRTVIMLVGGAAALPVAARAQQPSKLLPNIGFLNSGSHQFVTDVARGAFLEGLRRQGYVEGRNFAVEWRSADDKLERLPELAAELVRLNVDLIVAFSTPSALAAKTATNTLPS